MNAPALPPAHAVEPPVAAPLTGDSLAEAAASLPEVSDLLPRSVRELAHDLGLPLALRLVAACGGTNFYVPRPANAGPGHPLAARIGSRDLTALAAARGGETLDLPRGAAVRRAIVRRRIVEEAAAGASAAELAQRWGYSRSSIHRILRAPSRRATRVKPVAPVRAPLTGNPR